jgi:hypothetical protein
LDQVKTTNEQWRSIGQRAQSRVILQIQNIFPRQISTKERKCAEKGPGKQLGYSTPNSSKFILKNIREHFDIVHAL